nr:unnamed protein product [Callosobruchus chinensis]
MYKTKQSHHIHVVDETYFFSLFNPFFLLSHLIYIIHKNRKKNNEKQAKAYIIRSSLEYCSHIWGAAAPTTLSILDAVQRRAIRFIGDPALTCHVQPLSHRRDVGDLLLFYRYSNGFCFFAMTSIIPPPYRPARCTSRTSFSHPKAVVPHTSRTKRYDRTFVPRVSRAWI